MLRKVEQEVKSIYPAGQRRLLFKRWKLQKIEEFLTAKANKANKHT
jgi:hypothetical protein